MNPAAATPGIVPHAPQHFVEVGILLRLRGVARIRVHAHGGGLFRPEAEVHVEHAQKTPHQQPRADQQHAGKCDLRNHQRAANPVPALARRGTAGGVLQHVVQGGGGDLQRGSQAEDHAGQHGRQQTEGQHRDIGADVPQKRDAERLEVRQHMRSAARPESPPASAPQQDSATPSVSIWRISRRRPAPSAVRMAISFCRVAVRASSRLERFAQTISITTPTAHASTSKRRPDAAADVFRQRGELAFKIVALRMGARDLLGQDLHLGLGAADGDAGLQAADDRHGVSPAVGLIAERKRKIQIEVAAGGEDRGHIERGRQYAGHGDRLIIDGERAADQSGVGAEPPLPQTVAQQHGLGPVPFAFLGGKQSAELGLNSEHLEEILRHRHAAEPLRLAVAPLSRLSPTP